MFRLTNYKKLLRIILILIVTNYQRKNGSSSIEKFLENSVTNYYRKYSILLFSKIRECKIDYPKNTLIKKIFFILI